MSTVPGQGGPFVRPYREADLAAVYEVCVRTGDHGGDATGKFQHPDLLPDIFAGPYTYLEPGLAFVVDDGGRAVGYVLGTASTDRFVQLYRDRWLPRVEGRYPPPPAAPVTPDDGLVVLLHHPERMLRSELDGYPAHLHIDLLPGYQGGGFGRRLMETFFAAAARSGATGLHVVVAEANTPAHGFYLRLGFHRLDVPDPAPVVYYGRPLAP